MKLLSGFEYWETEIKEAMIMYADDEQAVKSTLLADVDQILMLLSPLIAYQLSQ